MLNDTSQRMNALPCVAVLAAVSLLSLSPLSVKAEDEGAGNIGTHFPGIWFGALDAGPFGLPGASLAALLTIHPDGTLLVYDAGDFGAPPINQVQSPQFGTWERTGPRSMRATTLFFSGNPFSLDTTLVKRVRFELHLDGADHLVGLAAIVEQLACPAGPFPGFLSCPNPISAPDSAWVPEPGGAPDVPFEAWRLRAK